MPIKNLIVWVLLICASTLADETQIRVDDAADLYSPSQENELEQKLQLQTIETNIQLYIVTRHGLNGKEIRSYAEEYFFTGTRSGTTGSGALFLIDIDGRDMGVYTFGPAISLFQSRIDATLDALSGDLANGQYNTAAQRFLKDLRPRSFVGGLWAIATNIYVVLGVAGVALLVLLILGKKPRQGNPVTPLTYEEKGSFQVSGSEDTHLRTTETRTPIQSSSSSGGSGGGGGGGGGGRSGGGSRSF